MGQQNNLRREVVAAGPTTCSWCGQLRVTLFRYGGMTGWFCNLSCFCSYHDIPRSSFDYVEIAQRWSTPTTAT